MTLPPYVQAVLDCLTRAGFEAYVVGGCVRDFLRGAEPCDWDITTSATPDQTRTVFREHPVVNTGLKHGTLTVLWQGHPLEITTYRVDGTYSDGRHPDTVCFSSHLEEDLSRRDFTVNAMAYHPQVGLVDPFGGRQDLQNGILRCVGTPARRFEEDALRILRALRFAATLSFTIEEPTAQAMYQTQSRLSLVSPERIAQELTKLLCGTAVATVWRTHAPLLFTVLPELAPLYGLDQNTPYHCYDAYEHTLHALEACPPDPVVRWAVLLHDIGKPSCRSWGADQRCHFYGHAEKSKQMAQAIVSRLRFSGDWQAQIITLVQWHDVPLEASLRAVRRRMSLLGRELFWKLLDVRTADYTAQAKELYAPRQAVDQAIRALAREIEAQGDCLSLSSLAVNGRDLMALGIPSGPLLGQLLQDLLNAVLDGTCENTTEALTALALERYRSQSASPPSFPPR